MTLTATLNDTTYNIQSAADMRALALAMRAACVASVAVLLDGEPFSSMPLAKAERSGGLVREIG